MNQLDLFPVLPELPDEAAVALYELLHELALVVENHYAAQVQRHLQQHWPTDNAPPEPDWDDDGPPF